MVFICMVLLAKHGLSADDVLNELARREGLSGIAEKESRNKIVVGWAAPTMSA